MKVQCFDQKWLDALKPYLGGRIVPFFFAPDGSMDAQKTIDQFCTLKNLKKIGPNGELLP